MTGIVLALAGLTCGDGGLGTGAARETVMNAVVAPLAGKLKERDSTICPAKLVKGRAMLDGHGNAILTGCEIAYVWEEIPQRLAFAQPCIAIYRIGAGRIILCFNKPPEERPSAFGAAGAFLLTLELAAPRKP
jgi:hypothetical protein